MSYALTRDLMDCSVAEVIDLMKSEYKTEDFNIAAKKQFMSFSPTGHDELDAYAKVNKMLYLYYAWRTAILRTLIFK